MSNTERTDDELLRQVLRRSDCRLPGDGKEIDDETISLFVAGALSDEERMEVLEYLDSRPDVREMVSQIMCLAAGEEEAGEPDSDASNSTEKAARPPRPEWPRFMFIFATVAATILLVWSLTVGPRNESQIYNDALAMLQAGEFDEVQAAIHAARSEGITSNRLVNLEAEAILLVPADVALAERGLLSHFGYEIGGVVSRDPTPGNVDRVGRAARVVSAVETPSETIQLNRGYILLMQGEADKALTLFTVLTEANTRSSLAWLGRGIAEFSQGDFESAESAFRRALELDPAAVDPLVNLAMALTEQGKLKEAIEVFDDVPHDKVSHVVRAQIAEQVKLLKQHIGE